jgi:hypothetical protein
METLLAQLTALVTMVNEVKTICDQIATIIAAAKLTEAAEAAQAAVDSENNLAAAVSAAQPAQAAAVAALALTGPQLTEVAALAGTLAGKVG